MEPAVFRPILRRQGQLLLLGAAGGTALGLVAEIPPLVAALFGAVAAAIATSARHASGVRLVASEERLELKGREAPLSARWSELRLAFGLTTRTDGDYQRFAILANPLGHSFAFGSFGGQGPCQPVRGADGKPVEVVDLEGGAVLLAILVQRVPAWNVMPEWLAEAAATPTPTPTPNSTPTATAIPSGVARMSAPPAARPERSPRLGLVGLLTKLGAKVLGFAGKLGTGAVKAVKGTNLAMAAASAAAYSTFTIFDNFHSL